MPDRHRARADHQNPEYPVCEGSGVLPLVELGFAITDTGCGGVTVCPWCEHRFSITRAGRIRTHHRAPEQEES